MATCPSGHESASDDFCDVCGVLIGAAPSLAPDGVPAAAAWTGTGAAAGPGANVTGTGLVPGEPCPRCGVTRAGQFCESCGYDFTLAGQDTSARTRTAPARRRPRPPPPPPRRLPASARPRRVRSRRARARRRRRAPRHGPPPRPTRSGPPW